MDFGKSLNLDALGHDKKKGSRENKWKKMFNVTKITWNQHGVNMNNHEDLDEGDKVRCQLAEEGLSLLQEHPGQ